MSTLMKTCPYCAEEIRAEAIKCRHCGTWLDAPRGYGLDRLLGKGDYPYRRLTRSSRNRMLSGVCGGLAEYVGVDPTLVRIAWVLLTVFTALVPGAVVYFILSWVIPPVQASSSDWP